jgi:hypothetical protein
MISVLHLRACFTIGGATSVERDSRRGFIPDGVPGVDSEYGKARDTDQIGEPAASGEEFMRSIRRLAAISRSGRDNGTP